MSSNRLAVYTKDMVITELMDHAFKVRRMELEKEKIAIGRAIYDDVFSADVLKLVKKVPKEWINTDDDMSVKLGGDFARVYFGEQRPMPAGKYAMKVYLATDPMCDRWRAYLLAKKTLDEDESKARAQARATLDSFTTVGALLKGWPEVEPFLQGVVKIPDRLPVVQVDILNNTFGLPVAVKGKLKGKAK